MRREIENTKMYDYILKEKFYNMKSRCYGEKNISYKYYGGKGIKICDEWLNDYNKFKEWALNNGFRPFLTIDRIDNSKGYSPDNCRWVTQSFNTAHNTRNKSNEMLDQKGKNIKLLKLIELRKSVGLSQEEFGKLVGITGQNQGQIELGKRYPSGTYILKVMKQFNLKAEDVLEMFKYIF